MLKNYLTMSSDAFRHFGTIKNLAPLRGLTTGNMGDLKSFFLKKQHIS